MKLASTKIDGVVKSITDGARRKCPWGAKQKIPSTALQRFFKHSAYYLYCLVPEKPLRLFIPLIFSGGIWNFLLSHRFYLLRASLF